MPPSHAIAANALLRSLPHAVSRQLRSSLTLVDWKRGEVLSGSGRGAHDVYFPAAGMISIQNSVEGRLYLELIGREGVVGLPLALIVRMPPNRTVAQMDGWGLRMRASALGVLLQQNVALHDRLHRYTFGLLAQSAQTVHCNSRHGVETRLASLLLQIGARAASDEFHVTQAHLGVLLGLRRAGVGEAASALRRRTLIRYARGRIAILGRQRLQAASCGCNLRRKQIGDSVLLPRR